LESKHKQLAGLASQCGTAMKKIILESEQNEEHFRLLIDKKIDHYCGIHERCEDSTSASCKNLPKLNDKEAIKDFMVFQ
jgi:hypothetical protein